jgi:aminoglycoside phosphotransferase (APT) family kinase protein
VTGFDAPATVEGIDVGNVSAWFADNIPGTRPPLTYKLIAGGRSNLTYEVVDDEGHRYVLRRPPTGVLLPTAHDMAREHRVIAALGPAGVPVPPALGLCTDAAVTGAPFYVMGFVDGHVLRTPAQVEAALPPDRRRRTSESVVEVLAGIHAVDLDAVGLGDLGRREGYIARQLRRWDAQYRSARDDQAGRAGPEGHQTGRAGPEGHQHGPGVAAIEAAHAILVERIPEQGPATIVHGDYRLDNTVVGDDGAVRAALDWELCTLGDPLADLGQLLAYWALPGDDGSPLEVSPTVAPGFFSREEIAQCYAARSGRDVSGLDFYVAFSFWKLACILEGVYARYAAGAMGDDGADRASFRRSIEWLGAKARERAEALLA